MSNIERLANAGNRIVDRNSDRKSEIIMKILLLILGGFVAAVAIQFFLLPNNIIDGGITGISMITSVYSSLPIALFLMLFNIPFLFIGYKYIGKSFVLSSLCALSSMSVFTYVLRNNPSCTNDLLVASIFGGILLGFGSGIIIRQSGVLDSIELFAIMLNKRTGNSVGKIVLIVNFVILASACLFFGWDRALYSLITWYIAYKVADIIIKGMDSSKSVIIVTGNGYVMGDTIQTRLGRTVTYFEPKNKMTGQKDILYLVVTRLELAKLRTIVKDKDEDAFMTISSAEDILGNLYRKKSIH